MRQNHLNKLAEKLKVTGIMKNSEKSSEGVWYGIIDTKRMFHHDETQQIVNFGVDGSTSGLMFTGKGDSCYQMIGENRDCITIHTQVSCAVDVAIYNQQNGTKVHCGKDSKLACINYRTWSTRSQFPNRDNC